MEDKLCLDCGQTMVGRADKKFCSDSCRNHYNNTRNRDSINYVRKINNALRKNRRILEGLNPEGKVKVKKTTLVDKGFDFDFYTNIYTTQKGTNYFYCYDQGYLPIDNNYFLLVKKQDYSEPGG